MNLFCRDSTVTPVAITASSALKPTPNYTYEPHLISDGNPNTTWAEGVAGDGIGEFVLFTFQNSARIQGVEIINGFPTMHPQLGDLYYLNNRLQAARIEFEDGTEEIRLRNDVKTAQTIKFVRPHISKTAKLIITGAFPGTKWKDTCIAEISFHGKSLDSDSIPHAVWIIQKSDCGLHCSKPVNLPETYTEPACKDQIKALYQKYEIEETKSCEKQFGKNAGCGPSIEGGIKLECVRK